MVYRSWIIARSFVRWGTTIWERMPVWISLWTWNNGTPSLRASYKKYKPLNKNKTKFAQISLVEENLHAKPWFNQNKIFKTSIIDEEKNQNDVKIPQIVDQAISR